MMHNLAIVVCCDKFGGIALNKQIPWLNDEFTKDDLQNFKNITNGNVCVMGRHTYNEILFHRKQNAKDPLAPIDTLLPGRLSYVLTRNPDQYPSLEGVHVEKFLRKIYDNNADTLLHQNKRIFIIGGEKLFIEAFPYVREVHMTIIDKDYKCDTLFPVAKLHSSMKIESGRILNEHMRYVKYVR